MNKEIELIVKMQVTAAQALALKAMFEYWTHLGNVGASRRVAFYCDGDGNFQPKCEVSTNNELPELTDERRKAAVIEDKNGHRLYDFDSVAWMLQEEAKK